MADPTLKPFAGSLDEPQAGSQALTPFKGQLDGEEPGLLHKAGDLGLSLAKGVVSVPEAAIGIADIPTGGRVGKFLENEGGAFGFRPKQAKDYLSSLQSDDLQSKQKQFQQADGVLDKAGVALSNPSLIANAVAESVPLMGAGAAPARALMAAAPRVGAAAAGAIGEGVVGAGSAAEAIRQETPDGLLTPTQSGLAAATGATTSAFGFAGGKVAQRLGIGDVDTMFAEGAARAAGAPSAKSVPRQVVEGAIAEGWLEELPQSVSEQVLQNLALSKPWHEGVSDAAVMGTLAGMAMGGGAAGVAGFSQPTPEQTPPPNLPAPVPPPVAGPTLALAGPVRGVIQVAGDGTARTPAYQAPGYVGDVTDVEPRAVNPVRDQVAAAAEQGGALSNAALTAIDTGVSDAMRPEPEQGPPQISLEEADARDQAAYEQFFAGFDADPVVSRYFENDDDIPDFDAASNASEEDFLRALGATDEDIQDAIATSSKSAIPQSSVASNAGPQAYEPAGPREGAGEGAASQTGQVNAGAIQQAAPYAPVPGVGGPVGADGAGSAATAVSGASGPGGAGTGAATGSGAGATEVGSARAGGRGDSNQALSAPTNLRDALVSVRQQKQEAANAQAAQAPAPAAAPVPGPAAAPAVEAAGPGLNIKAITAKQIPDMTDAELQAAIEHYGPAHKRTAKLQKEAPRRAAPSAITPTTTQGNADGPQASQAQQASPQPTQAAAAPAAAAGLTDGAPTANTGAQAAPAPGPQAAPPTEGPAQRVARTGEAWTRMPTVERQALAQRADLKPIVRKNVHRAAWADLNRDVQRKLAEAMEPNAKDDATYTQAVELVRSTGVVKRPAIQDALGIGFDEVNALMERMERDGVVTAAKANGERTVLAADTSPTGEAAPAAAQSVSRQDAGQDQAGTSTDIAPAAINSGADKEGNTVVGRRADGVMIRQDKNGVRWYAQGGVRIEETVFMRPTRQGMQVSRGELKPEFMTAAESEAAKPAASPAPAAENAISVSDENQAVTSTKEAPAATNSVAKKAPDAAKKPSADQVRAQADLMNALADLGDILGKGTRMNIVPEQEQKLLPVLTRVLDAAFRLGYHKFKDSAKFALDQIRTHLGDDAADALTLDHLQGAYIAMAGGKEGVDTKRAVIEVESKAEIEAHEAVTVEDDQGAAGAERTLTQTLRDELAANRMPKDNPALKKLVEAFDGKPADQVRMKQAQEALEAAIVQEARACVEKLDKEGAKTTFASLLRLYESQPLLNVRTSTSIANQAYSTPAPLAYLASKLAGINQQTLVHEPTGGTGMLLIGADPKNAVVNELNDLRVSLLKEQGFNPTQKDAAIGPLRDSRGQVDAVITNPPFGSVKGEDGKPVKVKVDGYNIGQIDHLIAAHALATMKDDGRAVLILGANKAPGGLSTDDRIFFNWLYSHYNVAGHFEVEGDLYARQGAGWPVRVIVINGREQSAKLSPVAGTIQRADNWDQVYEQFNKILDSSRRPVRRAGNAAGRASDSQARQAGVPNAAGAEAAGTGGPVARAGADGAGNVPGAGAGTVADRTGATTDPVGHIPDEQRLNGQSFVPLGLVEARPGADAPTNRPAKSSGTTAVAAAPAAAGNEFQTPYIPRSARKDEGVLIPSNMAQPTQDALNRLEDAVGDIDEFARKELGYESTEALHNALMGLQVDSVATAIYQIQQGKAAVIADQTGIGKGRQAASIIRWAARNGMTPVFVSVKPSLFTDMYGDLADIGTHDVAPFILNSTEWVSGADGEKLFANKPSTHRAAIQSIVDNAALPQGLNALFMTYSQINTANLQRQALMALAPNAVFVLDESHNAAGDSGTGDFMISVLKEARGVTYLSATYAKRPDNMPLYFKTDIGDAAADSEGLADAMAAGGLPLQTVVSNNLVKAGQMFRRERSYDGVSIASTFDTANRQLHERLSDEATEALRAIVSADKLFHSVFVKSMDKALKAEGSKVQDNAGNQVSAGVQHTEFSSVVHNFVRQMLLGLKAQTAADEAIASLKRGEKPIIAVENTMGSFLYEYAAQNNINQGDSLGAFDYRTVLSRALERSRVINVVLPTGDKSKQNIPLSQLDPITRKAYDHAQEVIDRLAIDIPVSPIDWMRAEIARAGFSVAEITGRDLAVDYSNPRKPVLSAIDLTEQRDKVASTRRFNGGELDALILNVAGSTGISLHASEKFADQRQRHMIVAQAAGDINIFMQMLGRVHRTGQVRLPKYTILSVDLPTEKRPTAVLSRKMKSLNANTSSNTESATSVKTADILNKYGDQIVNQYLADNIELARQLGVDDLISADGERVTDDIARKVTGRLALQPIEVQRAFYEDVESQYDALIEYLNKTNENDLEPRTFDFDAKEVRTEVLFDGPNKATPFGEDAVYGEYSIKAQGMAMKPEEIQAAIAESLQGKTGEEHARDLLNGLLQTYVEQTNAALAKKVGQGAAFDLDEYAAFLKPLFGEDGAARMMAQAQAFMANGTQVGQLTVRDLSGAQGVEAGMEFLRNHAIGKTFRVEINSEPYNAVITNVRNTHKTTGNPFSLSKFQITLAVNGALRSITVPATQFKKIEVSSIAPAFRIETLFKEQPANQRETAKIVTGNLLAAYGEIKGARGTIISFTKADGVIEQGILLPKLFDFSNNTQGDYRLRSGADALKFLQQSTNKDIGRFGISTRDGQVRVLPRGDGVQVRVPKSKAQGARYFLDKNLIAVAGDFVSSANAMVANVDDAASAVKVLDLLMDKQALYALPSMAEEAKSMAAKTATRDGAAFSRGQGLSAEEAVAMFNAANQVSPDARNAQRRISDARLVATQQLIDGIKEKWARAPEIIVARNMEDRQVPQEARDYDNKLRSQGSDGEARGFIYEGKVYLLSDELSGPAQIAEVLFHEVLGHYGLRGAFGDGLKPILQQIGTMRRRDVLAKAREYGMVVNGLSDADTWAAMSERDRLSAAEEVLAEMAQSTPEIGFVQRAIAAIRSWLRANVPGFKNFALTDDEIVRSYIIPARGFVNRSSETPQQALERAQVAFSRGDQDGGTPMFSRAGMADLASKARDELNRTFTAPGKLSWWHKTVGTMYNLAERSPAFKRVFEAAQGFVDDVSYFATDAAEQAPRLLPKLETWRDIAKRPITAADNAAVAKPVFEGTLVWTRDEAGKPVRVDDLVAAAEKLTAEEKARRLLRQDKISAGMLRAWQGLPLEQYEKLVDSRYESQIIKAGIVWTPAELKSMFKLTDDQVALYKEFRTATDRSLDTMARSDMLRYGGKDVADLRDLVMDAADAQDAAKILREHLQVLAKENPGRAGELSQLSSGMLDRAAKVQELQEQGYAPLSRFGKYTVDVVDANGERQYFGLFETQREANIMAMKMRKGFGQDAVSQGTLSNEEFKLLAGITPESLELFGNMLGLDSTGDDAQDQAFQEYLRRTKTNRSAMRRLIHRQGIAGYSEDVGRVLASFIYSNARQTSAGLHMGELGEAVTAIPKQQGELKDAAVQLSEYVKNPQEEAQAVRGLLFAQYLGGSIASAVVNMSQPAAVTFPWLSQFGGAKQAAAELGRAAKNLANKAHRYEADLAAALKQAEEEGTVSPQEVHQLMAHARGSGSLRPGDGTRTGDALASAGNALTRLSLAWGKVFGAAEQVNRRMTYIAAFRIAKAQKMDNPAAFAKKAVIETQFTYSKANKMKWGRGAVGATVMTFKTYSVAYLELLGRMWSQGGPEGKKAVLLALGMLMLMGGAGGLPFAEDAEDLVDGLAQLAGYNFNSKKAKQELLESVFGQAGAGFVERGITGLPGMPLDVSGRLGMGNLLPGTGIFKEKTDYTRDVLEVVGPVGDLAKRAASGARSILAGDVGAGLLQIAPAAVRNAAKGADMAATGMYRDDKGYKVLDTSPAEAAMKAIGFQPASVAKVQEANFVNQQAKNFYNMKAQEIRAKWARGIFEKDQGIVAEARADLEEWNRKNPEQRIVVSMPAVLKRVREMSKTKDQRIADTAPRAMRQQMREETEKARATL